jgi:signal transduction histidine kinase
MQLAERKRFLAIIVKETERLTRLINQMLDLAKIESGNAEWHPTELDLNEVIRESVDATSQLFREKGVALELALSDSVPRVMADRDRLMQVLINLLSNAVKFCRPGEGRVEIRLGTARAGGQDSLRVDVRDNGPGISPADHQTIFVRFKQVGDTLTSKPEGTGLGLPISRRIIEHFGGRLWVESEPDKGAAFSLVLPIGAPSEASEKLAREAAHTIT